jgi:hypothetical protein
MLSVFTAMAPLRAALGSNLFSILQILSLMLFEKTSLDQLLKETEQNLAMPQNTKQLNLFG